MADPTKPVIDYSYTGFQQANQDNPFPGTQLDNDLATLSQASVALINALKQVRRSDGALQNGIVTADSLAPGLSVGISDPTILGSAAFKSIEYFASAFQGALAQRVSGVFRNVQEFGVTMEGVNSDTGKFIDMLVNQGAQYYRLPEGELWLNDAIPGLTLSNATFEGVRGKTTIKLTTSGIQSLFTFMNGGNNLLFKDIVFDVSGVDFSGVSTRIFSSDFAAGQSSGELYWSSCVFVGDKPGDLIRLAKFGDGIVFDKCIGVCQAVNLWWLTLDTGPHNIAVMNPRFYGNRGFGNGGNGIRVMQSDPANGTTYRVEGLQVLAPQFLLGGNKCMEIGPSLMTTIIAACADQFVDVGIHATGNSASGADGLQILGGYGGSSGTTGVRIDTFSGNGVVVDKMQFNNLDYAVDIQASASKRTARHSIDIEGRNIRKSVVKNDSSDSVIEIREFFPQGMTEGSIHLLDTNGGGQSAVINNSNPSSFVRDAGVALPMGRGNSGALSWMEYRSVSLGLSVAQSIPTGVLTDVLWTVEDYDPMNCHVAGTAGITIQPGMNVCEFNLGGYWGTNSTGNRAIQLRLNGNVVREWARQAFNESPYDVNRQFATSVGQVWSVKVFQDSGASVNFAIGAYFQMRVLG